MVFTIKIQAAARLLAHRVVLTLIRESHERFTEYFIRAVMETEH